MRRTQQNADPQRRRGIRSRLVACVAAVAMLVTSVAAGTAVAAELGGGDAADQTTQNTATLEQQGTGDTGDNNQTTTNGDGRADGDQSSDADSGSEGDEGAADNGAADGAGTAESDVQSQGDAASKSANAVPAPQSDGAADGGESVSPLVDGDDDNTNLLTETFYGSDLDADQWQVLGDACMTAADQGDRLSCFRKQSMHASDTTENYHGSQHGNGFLQLTDNTTSSNGTVLNNTPIQTRLGLNVSFYQYQFGDRHQGTLADGIGFFLVDAENGEQIQIGPSGNGVGGALGYSAITWVDDPAHRSQDTLYGGIANGVLGVGLDTFGNYSNESQVGGADTRDRNHQGSKANTVTVRGPGEYVQGCPSDYNVPGQGWDTCADAQGGWYNGYDILAQNGSNALKTDAPNQGRDGVNEDGQAGGTLVNIRIGTPDDTNDGKQMLTVTVGGREVINAWLDSDTLPDVVNFGFSASTGAEKAVHFIRGLEVHTIDPTDGIMLTKNVAGEDGHVYAEGETVSYRFTVTNTGNTPLSNVTVDDPQLGGNVSCPSSQLAAGATMTCTASLTLTAEQVANGTFRNTATATGTTPEGGTVTSTDFAEIATVPSLPAPNHTKTISEQCDEQCRYELSLDVTGSASGTSVQKPADVVIVLDKSGSMDYSMNDDEKPGYRENSRWDTAADAIDTLLGGLLGQGKDNRVSLVTFSGDSNDAKCDGWQGPLGKCWGDWVITSPYDDASVSQEWTADVSDITDAINGIDPDGGTNWEAGLREAGTLLQSARSSANKYVVFVSDGDPTYYYDNQGVTQGDGGKYEQTAFDRAVSQAKNLGASVLSIGLGPKDNVRHMTEFADQTDGTYYSGDSEQSLNQAVQDILQTIRTSSSYTGVTITDTLSEYADFAFDANEAAKHVKVTAKYVDGFDHTGLPDPEAPSGDYLQVKVEGKTITVSFPGFDLRDGVTYTVTFPIAPTQQAYDEAQWTDDNVSQPFPSNAEDAEGYGAYLTYANKTTSSASGDSSGESKTVPYEQKPTFTVSASAITVTKNWTSEDHPDVATIQLYQDDKAYGDPVEVNENGYTFLVPAGPEGHTYRVEEVGGEGWIPSYSYDAESPSTVTESKDGVLLKGLCAQSATATVTNTPDTWLVLLGVQKMLVGRDWNDDDSFTFLLTPTGSNADEVPAPSGDQVQETTGGWLLTVNADDAKSGNMRAHEFEFEVPFSSEKGLAYTYEISEVRPSETEPGMMYSDATWQLTLNANSTDGYNFNEPVLINGSDDASDAQPGIRGMVRSVIFVNRYVAPVSALPLTGGDATARVLLVTGSGVLLVAGVAWLLARRRRV